MTGENQESKIKKILDGYFEGAFEAGLPFAGFGALAGAVYGAFLGWSLLPPETVNLVQVLAALAGLVVGAIGGAIAGLIFINVFWLGVLAVILFYIGKWLLST